MEIQEQIAKLFQDAKRLRLPDDDVRADHMDLADRYDELLAITDDLAAETPEGVKARARLLLAHADGGLNVLAVAPALAADVLGLTGDERAERLAGEGWQW